MRIGILARGLGVPVPTVRRWTEEFADFLTDEARGGDGRPRAFAPRDQRVLRRVRELLSDGEVTYAWVRRQLAEEGLAPDRPTEPLPEPERPATPEEREVAERFVAAIVQRAAASWWVRIERLEAEVRALRDELAALRAPADGEPAESASSRRRWPFG